MKLCVCSYGLVAEAFIVESEEECKSEGEDCYTEELDGETEEVEHDEDEDEEIEEDGEKLWWEADEADADPLVIDNGSPH
jgi:hypothetical protein